MTPEQQMLKDATEMAQLLKLIAHPERLLALCHLTEKEMNAGELSRASTLSPSAFSQHLALLRNAGIVTVRKEGLLVFYSLADHRIKKIILAMQEICQNQQRTYED